MGDRGVYGALEPLKLSNDPSTALERFQKYVKRAKMVFSTADIDTDDKKKSFMQIWGGDQMIRLFEHEGNVLETDTFMQAITKIENGLKAKINEIYPVYRLFCEMPQGPRSFSEWYPKVYDQAKQCNFTGYNADRAARDAMIMQTEDHKLRKKALAEAPSFNDFVKMGNAMESATAQAERMEKIEPVNACYGQGNKWQRSIPTAKASMQSTSGITGTPSGREQGKEKVCDFCGTI